MKRERLQRALKMKQREVETVNTSVCLQVWRSLKALVNKVAQSFKVESVAFVRCCW